MLRRSDTCEEVYSHNRHHQRRFVSHPGHAMAKCPDGKSLHHHPKFLSLAASGVAEGRYQEWANWAFRAAGGLWVKACRDVLARPANPPRLSIQLLLFTFLLPLVCSVDILLLERKPSLQVSNHGISAFKWKSFCFQTPPSFSSVCRGGEEIERGQIPRIPPKSKIMNINIAGGWVEGLERGQNQ